MVAGMAGQGGEFGNFGRNLKWRIVMIVEYIRYVVANEARGIELGAAYVLASQQLDAAPECLAYELTQCEEDPKSWILRIEWRSTEEHLHGFRKGPHFPGFLDAIRSFMPEIAEMRHYRVTDVQARKAKRS
jgi:quinol monooxygenase YgiN